MNHADEIPSILREEIEQYDNRTSRAETGSVLEIGDGIATVYGLDRAVYGELIEFETGAQGMVLNLERDSVGVVLLGSEAGLHEGSWAKRTGRAADVPVGDAMLGRTVNALGQPIDGLGPIQTTETRPIEHEAPGVVTREPVNVPLQTGILAIDAIIRSAGGQRSPLTGDRQTGKIAIAVTPSQPATRGRVCIYVAIRRTTGQTPARCGEVRRAGVQHHRRRHGGGLRPPKKISPPMPARHRGVLRAGMCSSSTTTCPHAAQRSPRLAAAPSPAVRLRTRRRLLPPLPSAGAGLPAHGGVRRRLHDGHPHH